jgi:ankyrin repeat protein
VVIMSDMKLSEAAYSLVENSAELRVFLADHPGVEVDFHTRLMGATSLFTPSDHGTITCLDLLLGHNADINARVHFGCTSHMMAINIESDENALLLMERKADVHSKDIKGGDALCLSLDHDHKTDTCVLLCCGVNLKAA